MNSVTSAAKEMAFGQLATICKSACHVTEKYESEVACKEIQAIFKNSMELLKQAETETELKLTYFKVVSNISEQLALSFYNSFDILDEAFNEKAILQFLSDVKKLKIPELLSYTKLAIVSHRVLANKIENFCLEGPFSAEEFGLYLKLLHTSPQDAVKAIGCLSVTVNEKPMNDDLLILFLKAIAPFKQVEKLTFNGNTINEKVLKAIIQFCEEHPTIKYLEIEGIHLTSHHILVDYLKTTKTIQFVKINIAESDLPEEAFKEAFDSNLYLQVLQLYSSFEKEGTLSRVSSS